MDAGEMARALLADAYGSSAAIALGDALQQIISRNLEARGLRATKIYSPGYGDWLLDAQKPLLAMLDAAAIGLRLTEDHLMIPAKSISGIIGGR
jgi:cobalamin-dependent methionine synthase I